MYPYRVFVSYSHEDRVRSSGVTAHLRQLGLRPFSDVGTIPGQPFSEFVREQILSAHIFMPLVTDSSSVRAWMHQATGFAIGSSIAVLPVLFGRRTDPATSALQVQGIQLHDDLSDIHEHLTLDIFENLAVRVREPESANYQIAAGSNGRLQLMIDRSAEVQRWGYYGRVRESSSLSLFSFPDAPHDSTSWDHCEGENKKTIRARCLQRDLKSHGA